MPRIAENTASLAADLRSRLDRLIAAAVKEGRDGALAGLRKLLGGPDTSGAATGNGRRRGRPAASAKPARTKSGKKRKNPWATMSPEARLKRVNAIRKGRGLPVKDKL